MHATKHATIDGGEELVLSLIQSKGDGRLLAREPVTHSDLLLARDETWLHGLRAGVLGPDLAALKLRVLPGENRGADRLLGYSIELSDNSRSFRRHFGVASLFPAARRAALALLKEGEELKEEMLKEGGDINFFLTAMRPDPDASANDAADQEFRVVRKAEGPTFEPAPLDDYLRASEPLLGASAPEEDKGPNDLMPVFVTREVWDEGRELARAGGEKESAAVWTGRLLRDTHSPEVFLVLDACIQAEHAVEEKLSVTFSGETWARIRQLLDLRRQRLGRPRERIVGSVHGHNFLPEADEKGRRACDVCALVKTCSRTTAAASAADLDWHRSVFVGQPWAVLLVWGHNAREQEDWRLYGLADGTLKPRTIRRLRT